jgi:GT2 family glycosyltransferase
MKLSVVIPTCDRAGNLRACLLLLQPVVQTTTIETYEIIVADDGRKFPATALAPDFPNGKWVAGPRRGPAANRNAGAAAASGDVLVFLDDDCLPSPSLLTAYAAAFSDPALHAAEGRIRADRPRTRMDEEAPLNESGGCFWSCNVALRRDFFTEIGGFDERFPSAAMEDVELRARIRRRSERIRFVPDALVIHPWRRMGGLDAVRKRALAHGIYASMPICHLPLPSYRRAAFFALREFCRRFAPRFVAFRGRGFLRASQQLLLPLWSVYEMKKALRSSLLAKK